MKPLWLVILTWVVDRIPEPGPKALSTVYGLLIFSVLVQIVTTIAIALGSK